MINTNFEQSSEIYPSGGYSGNGYRDYSLLKRHGHFMLGTIVGFGRLWFVKSLAPECQDITECRQLLYKEYEILASINHPSIVRVMSIQEIKDVGQAIIMEYVEGLHLNEYLQRANRQQRRQIANQLLDAMAYLHGQGVIHLDLKPENILVRGTYDSPQMVLIDFNLSDGNVFRYNKETGGNRKYSAPEQFDERYVAHPTADVWSLGKLLDEISPGWYWHRAIRHALRKDPQSRPANASVMINMMRRSRRYYQVAAVTPLILLIGFAIAMTIDINSVSQYSHEMGIVHNSVSNHVDTMTDTNTPNAVETPMSQPVITPETESPPPITEAASISAQKNKYELYEKERQRLVEVMHKSYAEGKEKLIKAGDDTSIPIDMRQTVFVERMNEIDRAVYAPILDFRSKCPDEVLAYHSAEWGTYADPDIRDDWKSYNQCSVDILERLGKECHDYKEEMKKQREGQSVKMENLNHREAISTQYH